MSEAVLIIDDEAALARSVAKHLSHSGYEVRVAETAGEGLEQLEAFRPDVVVCESRLPDRNGIEVVADLRRRDDQLPIIMLTGHATVELAVEAMKQGAQDFLTKPVPGPELAQAVARAIERGRRAQVFRHLQARDGIPNDVAGLVGESPAMISLRSRLRQLLDTERSTPSHTPPPVLLVGEPGTGKEMIARALHFDGPRRAGPFVPVDCAAHPADQLDAALFGYERGPASRSRRMGLAEAADGGTLYLENIGVLTGELQGKLLRLVEERRIRRAGAIRDHQVDVRVMTSAGPGLDEAVRAGRFRAELYFRLRVVELQVPALRQREGDIVALARWFVAMQGARYGKVGLALAPEVEAAMGQYRWPGNVRELRNCIEQAVLRAEDRMIRASEFAFCGLSIPAAGATDGAAGMSEELNLARRERELLVRALAETRWNVSRAARLLGVTRDTLRYRIDKYGLERP